MVILVTGGAGFIGTHLVRRAMAAGHKVRIIDNLSPQVHGADASFEPPEGVEFIRGDVTARSDWERALSGVDAVVHLAAETGTGQSMYEIERYYRVNVDGTALLFDILANGDHKVRSIVLASSRSVYGEGAYLCHACDPAGARRYPKPRSPDQLANHDWNPRCPTCGEPVVAVATAEDDKLAPASIYAATKLAQEDLVRVACQSIGIPHAILRFQNVYGQGQSLKNPYTGILSIFSTRIRLGLSLPIFEDGEESRDFVHVEDVAAAILASLDKATADGITANVGAGQPTSVMEVATLLSRLMGSDIAPHVTGEYRVGDIRHNFASLERLREAIGVQPQILLEDGINQFCEWVASQPIPQDMLDKANQELKTRKLMG